MLTAPIDDCPLCLVAALNERIPSGDSAFTCAQCGSFTMTDTARTMLLSLPAKLRVALSRAVQDHTPREHVVHITVHGFAQLMAPYL